MPTFWLKIIGIGVILMVGVVGLVQVAPYDDIPLRQARAVFLPADCAPPCFMGLRPGVMTAQEALDHLNAHPWVNRVERSRLRDLDGTGRITWAWSGLQPPFISNFSRGRITITRGTLDLIEVDTLFTYGDLYRALGAPDEGALLPTLRVSGNPQINHYAYYVEGAFWVQTLPACPLRVDDFWRTQAVIGIGGRPPLPLDDYRLASWLGNSPPCRRG